MKKNIMFQYLIDITSWYFYTLKSQNNILIIFDKLLDKIK
jgi:hypothetical protein